MKKKSTLDINKITAEDLAEPIPHKHIEIIKDLLYSLNINQRESVFNVLKHYYCTGCGGSPNCHCQLR